MTFTDGIDPTYPRMWDSIDAELADTIEANQIRRQARVTLEQPQGQEPRDAAAASPPFPPPCGSSSAARIPEPCIDPEADVGTAGTNGSHAPVSSGGVALQ